VQWYEVIFELIDMRSFSNLWYWIALAVLWSSVSHWVLGVPWDMITRARRHGGQAMADLETLAQINTGRMLFIARTSGMWIVGLGAFLMTLLGLLGFGYGVEFAQAVLFLFAPMAVVGALSLRTALAIEAGDREGGHLIRRLTRHRMMVQGVGMVSILLTSMFGMWTNMRIGVLG
jgi:hypothetical protein